MAPHDLLEIGQHLMRRVFSDVPGRAVDLLGSGRCESRDFFASWETRHAVMNGGRSIRQYTSRVTAMLINPVGGTLGDRLRLVRRLGRDVGDEGLGRFGDV
jgi:hypothetical protein